MRCEPTTHLGWTLDEVAAVTAGHVVGASSARISSVTTDSRMVGERSLFVAIRGERFDGNDFAGGAIDSGAAGAIVDESFEGDLEPRIVVSDTERALLALAAHRRSELTMPVIAITGSSGKTSTKDLVAAGIEGSWASPRSYNNEIGVPLTILGAPDDATALVVEVGSRGPGHIAALAPAIRPDVSIVTNLGVAHLEMFGSEEVLARAKSELITMIGPRGTAIVPYGEERLTNTGVGRRITFGQGQADVRVGGVVSDAQGRPTFDVDVDGAHRRVALSVSGSHQVLNAAAAIAAAVALGRDVDSFIAGMSESAGPDWRMDVHHGRFTVVNDAYNANPASVRSALDTVAAMPARRRIAVLGPMRELGPICQHAHREMGAHAAAVGFDRIVVVGADHGYVLGAPGIVMNAAGLPEAADTLRAVVEPGDVVLVKASRASGLERLALDLAEDAAR
jgi:UDP-N-acetylmuramoyl-tripeptide--D-alanyl-D-alanine ligase